MSFQSAKQASGSGNREAKGFLFLISLLLIPFLSQYAYRIFFYKPKPIDLTSVQYLTDSCTQKSSYTNVQYSDRKNFETKKSIVKKEYVVKTIEVNSADTTAFQSLPGIGSVYAARIVKYRKVLGGFVEIDQLKEVYGIKAELYEQVKPYLTINTKLVKKLPADSLWTKPYAFYHPYLSKELKASIQSENKKNVYSEIRFKEMVESSNQKLVQYIIW